MTPEEQQSRRHDKEDPAESVKYIFRKDELVDKLKEVNEETSGNKIDLQARCAKHNIATFEMRKKIIEGWEGKPKGMLQLLWERGFLNISLPTAEVWKAYPEKGRKDEYGDLEEGTSLKEMVGNLTDFVNEKTLLQLHAEARSIQSGCEIILIRSPKCHPEVAGEGIEYDWAAAKNKYRSTKLCRKKGAKNFTELVVECLGSISMKQRLAFSARARQYMVAYDTLAHWESLDDDVKGDEKLPETSANLLDRVVKKFKSHRGVGHDGSWVTKIVSAMSQRGAHNL